jgi:predicted RNase H-like HicB family nuclease
MEKIIMIIEKSKDLYDAYSDNCDGIYAAGDSIEAVKADAMEAISLIKKNLPEDRWPKQIKGEFEIEWKTAFPMSRDWYVS